MLGSDPTTVYLSELTAAAVLIDSAADESDDPLREAEASWFDVTAAQRGSVQASKPVFIPAPVFKPEFIPAPVFKPEFIPAPDPMSGRR